MTQESNATLAEVLREIGSAAARSAAAAEKSASVAERCVVALRGSIKMHRANVRRLHVLRVESRQTRQEVELHLREGLKSTESALVAAFIAGLKESDRGWKRTVIVLGLGVMLSNLFGSTVSAWVEHSLKWHP